MNWFESLARPAVVRLKAYQSARSIATEAHIFLDANESPGPVENDLNRYPTPQPAALVEAFADFYGVSPAQVLVGRGSDEAIDILTRTFCVPEQDAILILPPTYGMYQVSAEIQSARVLTQPLLFNGSEWSLPTDAICERLSSDRTLKMVYICSPNNPTGSVFPSSEIARICVAAQSSLVVVDEAYVEFQPELSVVPLLAKFQNLVVLRTLSKAWARAGLRCGVALAHPDLLALMHKVRAPYPIARPVTEGALSALNRPQEMLQRVEFLKSERQRLIRALEELACVEKIFSSEANFLLLRFRDSASVMRAAAAQGMILRSRDHELGLKNCVRITIGNAEENDTLLKILNEVARA